MIVSDYNKNFDYEFRQALDNLYNKSQLGPDDFRKQIIGCDLGHDEVGPIDVRKLTCDSEK